MYFFWPLPVSVHYIFASAICICSPASINSSIDLNKIYEIATKELGMVYARRDQVLLYDKTESEYVRQYEDIPEH